MIKQVKATAQSRRFRAGCALLGMLFLASCQPDRPVSPSQEMASDSIQVSNDDPPVGPGGPGGGK